MALATTPLSPANRLACGETFLELEEALKKSVRQFILKHGMNLAREYDEMYSDALLSFMDAYEHYKRMNHTGNMPFLQYLRFIVKANLIDHIVRPGKKRSDKEDQTISTEEYPVPEFQLQNFLDSLSEDGQIVARLVLDTPQELAVIISNKGLKPINYRTTIRKHLREIGWTVRRIRQTFLEIKEVL